MEGGCSVSKGCLLKMRSKFSKTWNSSKQPRKQIKFRANAPNHIKRTLMGAMLDKSLREKHEIKKLNSTKTKIMVVCVAFTCESMHEIQLIQYHDFLCEPANPKHPPTQHPTPNTQTPSTHQPIQRKQNKYFFSSLKLVKSS